jgi:hypothetical protein
MDKYTKWYNQITYRAQNRILNDYTETHHIKPRSLGGSDDPFNLVELTAREHFVCHWLLTKMYTGESRSKMINALWMMQSKNDYQKRYQTKITSRVYENLRKEYAKYISERNTGRVQPPEEKIKQVAAQTGRKRKPFSEEWLINMSKSKQGKNNPRYGVEVLESTRQKQREKATGRKQSEETIRKKADAIRGLTKPKQLCPHCQQMTAVNTYTRWHGDQCKQNPGRVSDEN